MAEAGTPYEGREDEFDLGGGSSFTWFYDAEHEAPIGIIEHHPKPEGGPGLYCGGYVAWTPPAPGTGYSRSCNHQLVSGAPGDEEHLTISPSLLCRTCGHHGFIRDGKWVPA